MTEISRLEIAIKHIESARTYTWSLLDGLDDVDWYWMPSPQVTHIAWQVGHLAMAQYGLTLFRQRGRQSEDSELMSGAFRKQFMKGTTPNSDAATGASVAEIKEVFQRVHVQALREIPTFTAAQLDEPVDPPHAAFATKFGALLFAADHEMLHAGQIGLLRRLMGKEPVR
jgi:hypothetical protein